MKKNILVLLACIPFALQGAEQLPATKDNAKIYRRLTIVPMPKQVKLLERGVSLNQPFTLIAGDSRQSQIGSEWIKREFKLHQAKNIPKLNAKPAKSEWNIYIGTITDNHFIKAASESGYVNIGPGNPGERGYEIRFDEKKKTIYIAGSDSIGTLYGCVTFAELFTGYGDNASWQMAQVRDWPDIINVAWGGPYTGSTSMPELSGLIRETRHAKTIKPEMRAEIKAAFAKACDRFLRWKMPSMGFTSLQRTTSAAGRALLKELAEYGHERGIRFKLWSFQPFVGKYKNHPGVATSENSLTTAAPQSRTQVYIRSWVLDDIRAVTADKIGRIIAESGLDDPGFHDTDTGGFYNPAQWNYRSPASRKRWGDDYAAASANKAKIFAEAIKKHAPNAWLNWCFYPYKIDYFDLSQYPANSSKRAEAEKLSKRYAAFWRKLDQSLPKNIRFAIRETSPEAVNQLRKLIPGRALYVWDALGNKAWSPMISRRALQSARYGKLPDDMVEAYYDDRYAPLNGLVFREYTWNANAPGNLKNEVLELENNPLLGGELPEIVKTNVLSAICRSLCGELAGNEVARAVSQNLDIGQIAKAKYRRPYRLDLQNTTAMAKRAAIAVAAIDRAWEQSKLEPISQYSRRVLIWLRENLHVVKIVLDAEQLRLQAEAAARRGDLKRSEQYLKQAYLILDQSRKTLAELIKQRGSDPVIAGNKYQIAFDNGWREMMADRVNDFKHFRNLLDASSKGLKSLIGNADIPKSVLKDLRRRSTVAVAKVPKLPDLDRSNCWDVFKHCPDVGLFLNKKPPYTAALAPTDLRIIYSEGQLIFFFQAMSLENNGTKSRDALEIYLSPSENKYLKVMLKPDEESVVALLEFDAKNKKFNRHDKINISGLKTRILNSNPDQWSGYCVIPLKALNSGSLNGKWRINCARVATIQDQVEISSLQRAGEKYIHKDKSTLKSWPLVRLQAAGFKAQTRISISNLKGHTETLSDSVATVATFNLELESNTPIYNGKLNAEIFDADGQQHRHVFELGKVKSLMYRCILKNHYRVEFEQPVNKYALKITFSSNLGVWSRWFYVGKWETTEKLKSAFVPGLDNNALTGDAWFPSQIKTDNGVVPVFNSNQGTVEFWVKFPDSYSQGKYTNFVDTLLAYGAPELNSSSRSTSEYPLVIRHRLHRGDWQLSCMHPARGGWNISADSKPLETGKWHHFAFCWDNSSPELARIFLNGKAMATKVKPYRLKRLRNKTFRINNLTAANIQLGALANSLLPDDAMLDNLRISDTVRYKKNFEPAKSFKIDKNTRALLKFDNKINGVGMFNNKPYEFHGGVGCLFLP